MAWGFSEELGGFVAYQDNGDGSYSPLVQMRGAAPATVTNLHNSASENAGAGVFLGPFVVPNDGRAYFLESCMAVVAPAAGAADLLVWQKETTGGATLAYILEVVRQSTTLYTCLNLACHIPLVNGEQLTCRYNVAETIALAAGAVVAGY